MLCVSFVAHAVGRGSHHGRQTNQTRETRRHTKGRGKTVLPPRYNFVASRDVVSNKPSRLSGGEVMRANAVNNRRREGKDRANKCWFQKGERLLKSTSRAYIFAKGFNRW